MSVQVSKSNEMEEYLKQFVNKEVTRNVDARVDTLMAKYEKVS